MNMYSDIVFLDGDEGRRVVDALTHTDGALVAGPSAGSIQSTFEYLLAWDYGEHDDLRDSEPWGSQDETFRIDGYVLSWNTGLGYVALIALVDEDGQVIDDPTCRGCGEPIDYCLDHTHVPDPYSEDWIADYRETSDRIGYEEV